VCARRSCQNEDGSDDPNKGTQLVEVYAMEIQARRRAADIHTRNTARPFRSTHSDVCGCSIKGQGSMHCRRCSERADKRRPSGAIGLYAGRVQPSSDALSMDSHRSSLWSDVQVCSSMCVKLSPTLCGVERRCTRS